MVAEPSRLWIETASLSGFDPSYTMKTLRMTLLGIVAAGACAFAADTDKPGTGPAPTNEGFVMRDGVAFWIENGRATRLENTPEGQMRARDGSLIAIPHGISGLPGSASRGAAETPGARSRAAE